MLEGEWGQYNLANAEEKPFREVLDNCTNVAQHFGLMGLLHEDLPAVRDELCCFSHQEANIQKNGVKLFIKSYPIIWEALEPKIWLSKCKCR